MGCSSPHLLSIACHLEHQVCVFPASCLHMIYPAVIKAVFHYVFPASCAYSHLATLLIKTNYCKRCESCESNYDSS
jgi:hypothetical protein